MKLKQSGICINSNKEEFMADVITQPVEPITEPPVVTPEPPAPTATWKNNLSSDMQNSPLLQKFDDSTEGLNKFTESHLNLEKLLGHEKVPIPKGVEDQEGWSRYRKAMGIPESAGGYELEDAQMPESAQNAMFDKTQFAEIMAKNNATPAQAEGMWKEYTDLTKSTHDKLMQGYQAKVDEAINTLRQDWGDSYDANVELGQTVINKFSSDKEMNDYLTATLSSSPQGIKFLQKVGEQFAENRIGGFDVKRYSMSPSEAKQEYEKILSDQSHPYTNPKATSQEHGEAVKYVNSLIGAMNKTQG